MNIKTFIGECHDKEVFKRLSIYLVSSWVLIQVLDVTSEPLGLPAISVKILLIILILGFPVNAYLVWRYHIQNLNNKGPLLDDAGNEIIYVYTGKNSFKRIYFTMLSFISALSLFITLTVLNNNFSSTDIALKIVDSNNKIAILKFGNNTGSQEYDIIGKMTSDWLIHGITENQIGQTVSPKVIEDYTNILNSAEANTSSDAVIKEYFKPGKIITGNYFVNNGKLIFQSSIVDGDLNKILISFKQIECSTDNPLDCIETLKQKVLGYLITENKLEENLQGFPPKYEAYQLVLEAKSNLDDSDLSLKLLDSAIAIDDNYFEPKVLRVANYYNAEKFAIADSLRSTIKLTRRNNTRQQNLLNLYEALLEGNSKKVYESMLIEYNHAPFEMESNQSTMTVAMQFVNKPEDVAGIFNKIATDKMALENCINCEYRVYIKAIAEVELSNYENVISLFKDIQITKDNSYMFQSLIAALVRSNKLKELTAFLDASSQIISPKRMQEFYFFTGKEFMLLNNDALSLFYLEKVVDEYNNHKTQLLAKAFYHLQNYSAAETMLEKIHKESPTNIDNASLLAMVYYANDKQLLAAQLIEEIQSLKIDYQFGNLEYALARYYASTNNKAAALDHLLSAVSEGYRFTLYSFQNDPNFLDYFKTDKFDKILKFWH